MASCLLGTAYHRLSRAGRFAAAIQQEANSSDDDHGRSACMCRQTDQLSPSCTVTRQLAACTISNAETNAKHAHRSKCRPTEQPDVWHLEASSQTCATLKVFTCFPSLLCRGKIKSVVCHLRLRRPQFRPRMSSLPVVMGTAGSMAMRTAPRRFERLSNPRPAKARHYINSSMYRLKFLAAAGLLD